jgi:hypothetical protein
MPGKYAGRLKRPRDVVALLDALMHDCRSRSAMCTLPLVSRVIISACRIGTPLASSVPNVRVKRPMIALQQKIADHRHVNQAPIDDLTAEHRPRQKLEGEIGRDEAHRIAAR